MPMGINSSSHALHLWQQSSWSRLPRYETLVLQNCMEIAMDAHYPTIDQPAAAEYVLAVLRDMHRQQSWSGAKGDSSARLSFGSTVAEWNEAYDYSLLGWREL